MKNPFRLPTPKELGKSKSNALPIRFFDDDLNSYTWDQYHEEIAQKFPIRNFLLNTIPMFFRQKITNKISHAWYWIRCHTYNKYHLIDIRQPQNEDSKDSYQWGWIDEDHQLLLACFTILTKHLEIRNTSEYNYHATPEGIQALAESFKNDDVAIAVDSLQLQYLKEMYEINKYWTIERKKSDKKVGQLLNEWHDARYNKSPAAEEKWEKLQLAEKEFSEKEEEMLIRLIKARHGMWT